jgi:RNA polymerase sigma-70 factor, ECF subfamily
MNDMRLDRAIARRLDASDIVQEVLFEASRRLQDYLQHADLPFHLWLRHIAKDRLIDAYRRHHRAQRRSVDREESLYSLTSKPSSIALMSELVDPELTPASAAVRQELEIQFRELLGSMNEEDREILLMRHAEKLSNQDAAARHSRRPRLETRCC